MKIGIASHTKGRLKAIGTGLQVRSFRWWFSTQVLSSSGTMTQSIAQSWLILRLTGSALVLALAVAATFGPSLLLGAWTGSLIDHFDRRKLLLVTQLCFIVLSAGLAAVVAAHLDSVGVVFAFATATGVVTALDMPARQIFVLDLVGQDRAANAVSLNEVVLNVSRVLGPAVGGALLATIGVAACFWFNAWTFVPALAVIVILLRRRGWVRTQVRLPRSERGRIRDGLTYAWRKPAIRSCVFLAVAGGMLFNMGTTLPLMVARAFHDGAGSYGWLMAAFGAGALLGAFLAGSGRAWPNGKLIAGLALATGVDVTIAAASPSMSLLYVGLAVAGFLSIWFIALANTLVQLRADPSLRGRVMGVWTMALPGMTPLTSLLVGAVATAVGGGLGAREAFGLSGAALIAAAMLGWRSLAVPSASDGPMQAAR